MKLVTSGLMGFSIALAIGLGSPILANESPKPQSMSVKKTEMKQVAIQQSLAVQSPVNINTAAINELSKLKGIGKVKAKAIVDYRSTYGKFSSIEDLADVPGIGDKLVEQNRDWMSL